MENDKIEVYNYLDMHAVINDNVIEVFSIKKLQTVFPEMDEFTLKDFEADAIGRREENDRRHRSPAWSKGA